MKTISSNSAKHIYIGHQEYGITQDFMSQLVDLVANKSVPDIVLYVEHPPTITSGRGANASNIIVSNEDQKRLGITVVDNDRGGDVTYHGPGQLVVYPIIDLGNYKQDLHWYLRQLEEVIIQCVSTYNISARRFPPHTGVWVGDEKMAAIGIKVSRWVTSHGLALNVNPNMDHFNWIIPCGIKEYGVTSMERVLGNAPRVLEVAKKMRQSWHGVFGEPVTGIDINYSSIPEKFLNILESGIDLAIE